MYFVPNGLEASNNVVNELLFTKITLLGKILSRHTHICTVKPSYRLFKQLNYLGHTNQFITLGARNMTGVELANKFIYQLETLDKQVKSP